LSNPVVLTEAKIYINSPILNQLTLTDAILTFSRIAEKMHCSQDVVISVLFPYLLPSFPVFRSECYSKEDMRHVLEELLMFFCSIPVEKTQDLLETFVRRVLSISSGCNRNLDRDIYFLVDIEKRLSFSHLFECTSSVYSLYACSFLIKHKVDIHEADDLALRWASRYGYKDTVVLLLQHNANVHAMNDCAFHWANRYGHKDIIALLLEHNADVHENNNRALQWASRYGHKDTVVLLLEHNAVLSISSSCNRDPLDDLYCHADI
jgi:hypothetical protein